MLNRRCIYYPALIRLTIILERGFKDDTVIIKINEEIFHRKGITTKLLIGMADSMQLNVPEGLVTFKISLPDKNIIKNFSAEILHPSVLKLSLEEGELKYNLTTERLEDLGYF